MSFRFPPSDDVRRLCEEQGIGLNEGRNVLLKEAIIEAIEQAKTFEDAKPALLALVRNAHVTTPHPASLEARRRR